jgi:hypothetical protein
MEPCIRTGFDAEFREVSGGAQRRMIDRALHQVARCVARRGCGKTQPGVQRFWNKIRSA